jgi:hypothetical protein
VDVDVVSRNCADLSRSTKSILFAWQQEYGAVDLTKSILREIANGKNKFEPQDSSIQAIKEFQPIAKRLKSAHEKNLISKAFFQVTGTREIHGMYITVLVSGGLTLGGEEYLNGTHEDFRRNEMTNQVINIHSANAIQIGDHNTQQIAIAIKSLIEKIESCDGSEAEKVEAKNLLQRFLEHPLVAAVVGATISL